MANFTVQDILGCARAIAGLSILLFFPGYLTGAATNLFGFRGLRLAERAAWSTCLSFAIAPFLNVAISRCFSLSTASAIFSVVATAAILLLIFDRHPPRPALDRYTRLLAWSLVTGVVIVVAELIDIQIGNKLYLSVTVLDQAYRVSFVNAVAHTGVPPHNPLFYPGQAQPLRYYYFWYALCATCMKLEIAHITARQALIASSAWCGLGLAATFALFCRHFLQVRQRISRHILAATLLLAVTGADILPVVVNLVTRQPYMGDPEWWSTDQVSSWLDSILWVPNHTASLICSMAAFLLLWRTQENLSRVQQIAATLLAGCAAASAFGSSIYVAAGFAMLMVAWSARLLLRDHNYALAIRNIAAALSATILLLPWLHDEMTSPSGTLDHRLAGPGHFLRFGVRKMIDSDLVTRSGWLEPLHAAHPILLDQAVRLLLLLPGYFVEFGFYAAILLLAIRQRASLIDEGDDGAEPRRTALFLTLASLLPISLLRSLAGDNNDFGYRAALFPSFFLLLLGADKLLRLRDTRQTGTQKVARTVLGALLVLGVLSTVFQAASLRLFYPITAALHSPESDGLPQAAFASRAVFTQAKLPPDAVVQINPSSGRDIFYLANLLYAERQMVTSAADDDCGAIYGGDPIACVPTQQAVRALYAFPAPATAQAAQTCRTLGASYLAASIKDPAWADRGGWVWGLPVVADTGGFRVVRCA